MIKLGEARKDKLYTPILPLLKDGYKCLLKALSSNEKVQQYAIVDPLRLSSDSEETKPVTFAASTIDEKGYELPLHPELYDKADLMSKQLLDYMFVLQPTEACKIDQNP